MGTFKLDDKEIPFEPGDTIIRAAWRQGIEIPHYCWHPGLSAPANCRMCLVEVKSGRPVQMPVLKWSAQANEYTLESKPKLVPACQQEAADGMVVGSDSSAEVTTARASVQEMLLLNHPVDCPICDQAGECKLQDYWLDHQHELKRKHTEPVHKPKGVRFGPTIVYDAERCIVCTRCIRVCDELAHDHVLDLRDRSNKSEVVLAPGRKLEHKYTLMTEHVCPVGALTSRDFRFKARVWFLKSQPGVCTGCATGCNSHVDFDPRTQQVQRLRPRDNLEVNKYWMCDDGMMSYKQFHEGRVLAAAIGRGEKREPIPSSEAVALVAARLGGVDGSQVAVVLSAQHSSEDNTALVRFGRQVLKTSRFHLAALGGWEGDKILRHSDNNPNRAGALRAAQSGGLPGLSELANAVKAGQVQAIIALGWAALETQSVLEPLGQATTFVSLTSNEGSLVDVANVVVGVASVAESSGTFVNGAGKEQSWPAAIVAPPGIKPAWETLVAIARAMGSELPFSRLSDLRALMAGRGSAASGAEARI